MTTKAPTYFRKSGEGSIVSYTFSDLIQNQAYTTFYTLIALDNSASENKLLSQQAAESQTNNLTVTLTGSGGVVDPPTLQDTHNFDLPVNITQTIEGNAVCSFGWNHGITFGSGTIIGSDTAGEGYIVASLIMVRDGSETVIGSGKSQTVSESGSTTSSNHQTTLLMDCAETTLHSGDTLRLKIEIYLGLSQIRFANATSYIIYYPDPLERNAYSRNYGKPTADDEVYSYAQPVGMKINIPFRPIL